jgi:hypothetical protein
MVYKYQEIRDMLMILSKFVQNGTVSGNSKLKGYAVLTPRDKEQSELLANFLAISGIKYTDTGEEILFRFGQNEAFDETVVQMDEDHKLMINIANRLGRAQRYKNTQEQNVIVSSEHESR